MEVLLLLADTVVFTMVLFWILGKEKGRKGKSGSSVLSLFDFREGPVPAKRPSRAPPASAAKPRR